VNRVFADLKVPELINQSRDLYLEHFRNFAELQTEKCGGRGGPEAKFEIPERDAPNLFRNLYCTDFVINHGDRVEPHELQPDTVLTFQPFTYEVGRALVLFERLQWDDVVLHYDGPDVQREDLNRWFEYWFDPDDSRLQLDAPLCGSVHALFVRPRYLCVDFGTATTEAFWDLLDLVTARASYARVTCQDPDNQAG
jgi:hypothetical protein